MSAFRRACFVILPLLLLPILLINFEDRRIRCAYVILLTSLFWIFEPIPLGASSLLPVVLLPTLSVLPADQTASCYMQEANMMFVATLTIAISIVECNLHRRLALSGLLIFGTQPRYLILGILSVTCFLSIWVNNVAIAAMMIPVVDQISEELFSDLINQPMKSVIPESEGLLPSKNVNPSAMARQAKRIRICLFLSVMYGANIGAVTTITSAASNLVFSSILDKLYPNAQTPVDYVSWMLYCLPITIISIFFSYLCILLLFFYKRAKLPQRSQDVIRNQYKALGKMRFSEFAVLFLFVALVTFWLFRDPTFMKGWATYFQYRPKDSTVAVATVLILLLLPEDPKNLKSRPILPWEAIQAKLSWTVILLVGGNFALAEAAFSSGLSDWMSSQLTGLTAYNPKIVCILLSVFSMFLSEILANAGVVTVFIPIFAQLAQSSGVNPLLYMITPTVASNFCFLLPVGTPANTIIYEHAKISIVNFLIPGILVKLCTVIGCSVAAFFLSDFIFLTDEFPGWIPLTLNTTTTL